VENDAPGQSDRTCAERAPRQRGSTDGSLVRDVLPAWRRTPVLDEEACRFRLRSGPSPIHNHGIFAGEAIPARRRVIEYTGEKIDLDEAWRRSVRPQLYFFELNPEWVLDGAIGGSGAEFINHACEPNLIAHLNRGRIWLSSLRAIATNEELTLDYRLEGDGPPMACHCGGANCRGWVEIGAG
jgi:hypothetical protein